MYLAETPRLSSSSRFRNRKSVSVSVCNKWELAAATKSFDEKILGGLKSLMTNGPMLSLTWLGLAVDFMSLAHNEAKSLISNLKPSNSSESLNWYLDDVSLKILNLCNSISSHINRLRRRRLLPLNFALHLLSDTGEVSLDKLRRARDSLSSKSNDDENGLVDDEKLESLMRDLAVGLVNAPPGKISAVGMVFRRTINAVGFITLFVSSAAVSALGVSTSMVSVRVPAEFLWADSFNSFGSKIVSELNRGPKENDMNKNRKRFLLEELDDVESRTEQLTDVIDNNVEERLSNAVKELKRATEALAVGLERLGNGVNGMFDTVLSTRNGMLRNLKV